MLRRRRHRSRFIDSGIKISFFIISRDFAYDILLHHQRYLILMLKQTFPFCFYVRKMKVQNGWCCLSIVTQVPYLIFLKFTHQSAKSDKVKCNERELKNS
jgi:hypothetical protein